VLPPSVDLLLEEAVDVPPELTLLAELEPATAEEPPPPEPATPLLPALDPASALLEFEALLVPPEPPVGSFAPPPEPPQPNRTTPTMVASKGLVDEAPGLIVRSSEGKVWCTPQPLALRKPVQN
jgi:hypothetical protein